MKKRVKTDSAILSFIIILSGFLLLFPHLYVQDMLFDDIFDFMGMIIILSGTFLRMVSRGFKKANSHRGGALVVSGPYQLVRNPMYLGSFLMGAGFILIVWPFWALPIFGMLFFLRFNKQIVAEEKYLTDYFKRDYVIYQEKVPRLFPTKRSLEGMLIKEALPLKTAWTTKEKRGLIGWPILALCLEMIQESVVFGFTDFQKAFLIFLLSSIIFGGTLFFLYRKG